MPQFWVSFLKEIPKTWVPFFMKKSLTMGMIFQTYSKAREFLKKKNTLKMGTLFLEKSLNMGTFFWKHYQWTWVWVPSCLRHIPDQSKSETPPQVRNELISLVTGDCTQTLLGEPDAKRRGPSNLWSSPGEGVEGALKWQIFLGEFSLYEFLWGWPIIVMKRGPAICEKHSAAKYAGPHFLIRPSYVFMNTCSP